MLQLWQNYPRQIRVKHMRGNTVAAVLRAYGVIFLYFVGYLDYKITPFNEINGIWPQTGDSSEKSFDIFWRYHKVIDIAAKPKASKNIISPNQ